MDSANAGRTVDPTVAAPVGKLASENHIAPTWPHPGQQQQMHLDVSADNLPYAVEAAIALGAREAEHQPAPGSWRVLIDPAGHPFCLTTVMAD